MIEYIIMPESFRQEVCKGLDPARAAAVLERKGLLLRGDGATSARLPYRGLGVSAAM